MSVNPSPPWSKNMASPDMTELIVGALGGGGLMKLIEVMLQRRRTSAETGKIQAETETIHTDNEVKLAGEWKQLADGWERRFVAMEAEVSKLRDQLMQMAAENATLKAELAAERVNVQRLERDNDALRGRIQALEAVNSRQSG